MSPSSQTAGVFGTPLADSMETTDDLAEPRQENGRADFYVTRLIRAGVAAAFVIELAHLVLVLMSTTALGLTFGSHLLNIVAAGAP